MPNDSKSSILDTTNSKSKLISNLTSLTRKNGTQIQYQCLTPCKFISLKSADFQWQKKKVIVILCNTCTTIQILKQQKKLDIQNCRIFVCKFVIAWNYLYSSKFQIKPFGTQMTIRPLTPWTWLAFSTQQPNSAIGNGFTVTFLNLCL